jgi:hypothetical protein
LKKIQLYHLDGKLLFRISLTVIVITILAVYFWGLGAHRTFYENSLISTTVLSSAFFLFISVGLYKGVNIKGESELNLSMRGTDSAPWIDSIDIGHIGGSSIDLGDGILEAIAAFVLWILAALVFAILLWLLSTVVVGIVAIFSFMLYWVFLRALRLVFRNSQTCKGNLVSSLTTGLVYTILYNFWIYGIFLMAGYLKGIN